MGFTANTPSESVTTDIKTPPLIAWLPKWLQLQFFSGTYLQYTNVHGGGSCKKPKEPHLSISWRIIVYNNVASSFVTDLAQGKFANGIGHLYTGIGYLKDIIWYIES